MEERKTARQSRTYSESKVYHIMFRGVNYQDLFEEKQDYQKLYEPILNVKKEMVSNKISSLLLFNEKIALHVTRPMRWDSDHVVLFDDETKEIAKEIVRNDALDRVFIATDYFDASINRISAWVTGIRNVHKALLFALLQPNDKMKALQEANDMTSLMVLQEDLKTAPLGDVWAEYLSREGIDADYITEVKKYEEEVLLKR